METRHMTDKRKTAPWVPNQTDWWADTVGSLLEWGGAWDRGSVMMDLRWWADQERMGRRKRPGRVALSRRWGWSDKRTRAAMKNESTWGDPQQVPKNQKVPLGDHSGTTEGPNGAPKPPKSQRARNHRGTTEVPPGSPRADLHKNTRTQPHTYEGAKAPLPDKPDPTADTWARMLEIRAWHRPKARTIKLTGYRRRVLNGRLKDHDAEALLRVTEWHYTSNHTTATWNREQGHDLDTLIRPANFDRYLEIAHSEADHSHHPKPQTNGRNQYRSLAERMGTEAAAPNPTPQAEVVVVDFTPKGADHG